VILAAGRFNDWGNCTNITIREFRAEPSSSKRAEYLIGSHVQVVEI